MKLFKVQPAIMSEDTGRLERDGSPSYYFCEDNALTYVKEILLTYGGYCLISVESLKDEPDEN